MNIEYHFPTLWNGKDPAAIVAERHDIVYLFDATNCNPNGDPDTGNMPRLQPDSLLGLVTDVCLKRKVRNFFARHTTSGNLIGEGDVCDDRHNLFIREGAVIQRLVEAPSLEEEAKACFLTYSLGNANLTEEQWTKKKKEDKALPQLRDRAYKDALCQAYFDVRYFGAVVSTEGPLKGSFYGQIRGPLQITFAESLDKILQLDFSITRCAVASEKEAEKKGDDNRTMGRKHAVQYGLYHCHIHFSPAFAAKTGFTYADLDNFLFALTRCLGDYNVDGSAARPGGMRVVGLIDFAHTSALGNAPAHKLFNLVEVQGKKNGDGKSFVSSGSEFPQGLEDYTGKAPDGPIYVEKNKYGQVTDCTVNKPEPKDGNEAEESIVASRIIWEF
ncbi:MAG: type I-C CRISPR-associated protein Cas7/Csd2 [Verrucomicrobia bacterium]|nr:type I-C CRISPR-associated protein Cas7/Csd2 [Verrucomicrobiota bacterium]